MQVLLTTGQLLTFKDVKTAMANLDGFLELLAEDGKRFAGFPITSVIGWWSTKREPRITTL